MPSELATRIAERMCEKRGVSARWPQEYVAAIIDAELADVRTALEGKIRDDHASGDYGYLTQDGAAECVMCGASANCIANIEHPDCSQVAHDRLETALAVLEVRS